MLPYTQINDQHFPGMMLLPINIGTFGISTAQDLRIVHLLLICINYLLLFKLLRGTSNLVRLSSLVLYALLFYSWEGNILWIDSFVATLSLLGFYLLYTQKALTSHINFFLTGLIFGLILMFKQHGIVLCAVSSLWVLSSKPSLSRFITFILGGAVPMGLAGLYLYRIGVFDQFWFWTIYHNLFGYTRLEGRPPLWGELARLLAPLSIVVTSVFFSKNFKPLPLLFLVATLVFCFPRYGLIHAQIALPIVIFVFAMSLQKSKELVFFAFILISLCLVFTVRTVTKDIPNKIKFYDSDTIETVMYVKQHADLSKPIYVYGVNDNIYHLTSTLPPQKMWIELLAGNIIPGVEDTLISTLKSSPPQFILLDSKAYIDGMYISEFTPNIWKHINNSYKKQVTLRNGVEVWYPKNEN